MNLLEQAARLHQKFDNPEEGMEFCDKAGRVGLNVYKHFLDEIVAMKDLTSLERDVITMLAFATLLDQINAARDTIRRVLPPAFDELISELQVDLRNFRASNG